MRSRRPSRRIGFELRQVTLSSPPLSPSPNFISCTFHHDGEDIGYCDTDLLFGKSLTLRLGFRFSIVYKSPFPGDSLLFTFGARDRSNSIPLAQFSLPLERLVPEQQVTETFQMESITDDSPAPRVSLRIADLEGSNSNPFDPNIPSGRLLPPRESSVFARPLFSSSGRSAVVPPRPSVPAVPEEEEEEQEPVVAVSHPAPVQVRVERRPVAVLPQLPPVERFSFFPTPALVRESYRHPPALPASYAE
jgi:hypothetical protein